MRRRYVARPPLATERLWQLDDGRLVYRLRHRWRDDTTALVFAPSELIERLAALVPPPRAHLVRYHGVLAPAAAGRAMFVPSRSEAETPPCRHRAPLTPSLCGNPRPRQADASEPRDAQRPPRYYSWHELMQRVFAVDILIGPRCASRVKTLAQIHPSDTTRAILDCPGLASRPPPIAPARSEPEQLTLPDGDLEAPAD